MHFDVPKVVRIPGYDDGHDEESRNGRDIKIDILEAYVWISEVFRVKSGFYRSTVRLPEPPGSYMGLSGREERWPEMGRAPLPPLVRIGQGGGAGPLPPLSPLFPPFANPIPTRIGGEVLYLEGVGLLLARPMMAGRPPPLEPLYTEAGAPQRHTS